MNHFYYEICRLSTRQFRRRRSIVPPTPATATSPEGRNVQHSPHWRLEPKRREVTETLCRNGLFYGRKKLEHLEEARTMDARMEKGSFCVRSRSSWSHWNILLSDSGYLRDRKRQLLVFIHDPTFPCYCPLRASMQTARDLWSLRTTREKHNHTFFTY